MVSVFTLVDKSSINMWIWVKLYQFVILFLIKNEIEYQSQFNQTLQKILTMLRCILVQIWKY